MVWLILALVGAFATSMTTILAKIGIKDVNSNFATAYRTAIVIVCSLIVLVVAGSFTTINKFTVENIIFLVLSGLATGCSWLCYYRALKLGDVNKVAPIDKSSFVLTSILLLIFFFGETTNDGDLLTIVALVGSMASMLVGTYLMITKKEVAKDDQLDANKNYKWLIYAILSAVFAALVTLFVKIGLSGINSNIGTLFRTIIVFIFAMTIVIFRKDYKGAKSITKKSWLFLTLSGIATGVAWLSEYAALNFDGANPIAVSSIGKLSILLTMLFSLIIIKEKFTKKSLIGLALITIGIIIIVIFSL